jgi:hypothetical protein
MVLAWLAHHQGHELYKTVFWRFRFFCVSVIYNITIMLIKLCIFLSELHLFVIMHGLENVKMSKLLNSTVNLLWFPLSNIRLHSRSAHYVRTRKLAKILHYNF